MRTNRPVFSLLAAPLAALLVAATMVAPSFAQQDTHGVTMYSEPGFNRSFALIQGTSVMLNGVSRFGEVDSLSAYAHAHPGHYILFKEGDTLRRIDDPQQVAEAERAYAPMLPLNARQEELSAEQKPLAEKQSELREQQRAARGNPAEQGRIGRLQGELGQQQGEIGRKQGEVGQQQGEIGRAFYLKVQQMLSSCLDHHSCPALPTDSAQR